MTLSKLIIWLDEKPKKGRALLRILYDIFTILRERIEMKKGGKKKKKERVIRGTVKSIEITIYKCNKVSVISYQISNNIFINLYNFN